MKEKDFDLSPGLRIGKRGYYICKDDNDVVVKQIAFITYFELGEREGQSQVVDIKTTNRFGTDSTFQNVVMDNTRGHIPCLMNLKLKKTLEINYGNADC